jgi:hypothetical protein
MSSSVQKVTSIALSVMAVGTIVLAVIGPNSSPGLLESRFLMVLCAVGLTLGAVLTHPGIRLGLAMGVREFVRACRDVFDGGDDDGPKAA